MILMGLLLQFLIIYYAFKYGTQENNRLLKINNNLLTDIARKQGVNEADIDQSNQV